MESKLLTVFAMLIALEYFAESQPEPTIRYANFSLFRAKPQTCEQLNMLNDLFERQELHDTQFWSTPSMNQTVYVLAGPGAKSALREMLLNSNTEYKVTIPDVGSVISKQHRADKVSSRILSKNRGYTASEFYNNYQSFDYMEKRIHSLAEVDRRLRYEVIGKSSENRNLYLVKISEDHGANRPVIFIDGGHHAREWISPATALYLLESFVSDDIPRISTHQCKSYLCFKEASNKTRLELDTFDYWFVPIVNPDGYEYSRSKDRFWRKTRSIPEQRVDCSAVVSMGATGSDIGVDANRNYPSHWREVGASTSPCVAIYAGPNPLSEPESFAVATTLKRNAKRIKLYISLHSFAQKIMAPYGYTTKFSPNHSQLEQLAKLWVRSIKHFTNTLYEFGTSARLLGLASGASDDYAYENAGIKLSYTIELPDAGKYGFLLPPANIVKVANEALIGLRAMADGLKDMLF